MRGMWEGGFFSVTTDSGRTKQAVTVRGVGKVYFPMHWDEDLLVGFRSTEHMIGPSNSCSSRRYDATARTTDAFCSSCSLALKISRSSTKFAPPAIP